MSTDLPWSTVTLLPNIHQSVPTVGGAVGLIRPGDVQETRSPRRQNHLLKIICTTAAEVSGSSAERRRRWDIEYTVHVQYLQYFCVHAVIIYCVCLTWLQSAWCRRRWGRCRSARHRDSSPGCDRAHEPRWRRTRQRCCRWTERERALRLPTLTETWRQH